MKKLLLALCGLAISSMVYSQNYRSEDIYMIGTSSTIPASHRGIFNGFGKYIGEKRSYIKAGALSFSLGSVSKDYEMFLLHINYANSTKTDKVILDRPISDLNNFTVIDIDHFISTKSRSQVWQWMIDNKDKRVWVIDRNDFYKSSPSLGSNDKMKLIQTEIWLDNIPDNVLNP